MKYDDPLKVLEKLTEQKVGFTFEFREEYHDFLEVLIHQVFEPNGYKLVAIKQEEGNPVILNNRTTDECKTLISKYKRAGYEFVEMKTSSTSDFTNALWDLQFNKRSKKS